MNIKQQLIQLEGQHVTVSNHYHVTIADGMLIKYIPGDSTGDKFQTVTLLPDNKSVVHRFDICEVASVFVESQTDTDTNCIQILLNGLESRIRDTPNPGLGHSTLDKLPSAPYNNKL